MRDSKRERGGVAEFHAGDLHRARRPGATLICRELISALAEGMSIRLHRGYSTFIATQSDASPRHRRRMLAPA